MQEKEQLYEFIMGLNEILNTVKTHSLSRKSTLSLGATYNLVAQDGQLIMYVRKLVMEAATFQAYESHEGKCANRRGRKCTNFGKVLKFWEKQLNITTKLWVT